MEYLILPIQLFSALEVSNTCLHWSTDDLSNGWTLSRYFSCQRAGNSDPWNEGNEYAIF